MRTVMINDNNDEKKGGHCVFLISDKFMKIPVFQVSSYWRRPFLFFADITIFN